MTNVLFSAIDDIVQTGLILVYRQSKTRCIQALATPRSGRSNYRAYGSSGMDTYDVRVYRQPQMRSLRSHHLAQLFNRRISGINAEFTCVINQNDLSSPIRK